jgi:hypothetical protein
MSFGEEAQQTVDRPVHSRLSRRIDQKKERVSSRALRPAPNSVQRWTDATKFAKGTHDQDIRMTVEQNSEDALVERERGRFFSAAHEGKGARKAQ